MEITEERVSKASRMCCIAVSAATAIFWLLFWSSVQEREQIAKFLTEMDLSSPSLLPKVFLYSYLEYLFGVILILGIWKESRLKDPLEKLALNFSQLALLIVIWAAYSTFEVFKPLVQLLDRIGGK